MSFKIGLALGGGAARGLAHLGIIRALRNDGIPINIISGTSIGAVIGAIYAENPDIDRAIRKVDNYLNSPDFNNARLEFIRKNSNETQSIWGQVAGYIKSGFFLAVSLGRNSFISEEIFKKNLEHILPQKNIEDCPTKFGVVSMDLDSGEEKISTEGNLIEQVMASCAIPGIFPPIQKGESRLADGSWINPVPVKAAKLLGADFVIGADVSGMISDDVKANNGFEITLKAAENSRVALTNYCLKEADISLQVHLKEVHWADFSQLSKCVRRGEEAARSIIGDIKKKVLWKRLKKKLSLKSIGKP